MDRRFIVGGIIGVLLLSGLFLFFPPSGGGFSFLEADVDIAKYEGGLEVNYTEFDITEGLSTGRYDMNLITTETFEYSEPALVTIEFTRNTTDCPQSNSDFDPRWYINGYVGGSKIIEGETYRCTQRNRVQITEMGEIANPKDKQLRIFYHQIKSNDLTSLRWKETVEDVKVILNYAPFCGDGMCNGAETNLTCVTDCPLNEVVEPDVTINETTQETPTGDEPVADPEPSSDPVSDSTIDDTTSGTSDTVQPPVVVSSGSSILDSYWIYLAVGGLLVAGFVIYLTRK